MGLFDPNIILDTSGIYSVSATPLNTLFSVVLISGFLYKLFGNDAKGLYALNQELLARVYAAPSLVL